MLRTLQLSRAVRRRLELLVSRLFPKQSDMKKKAHRCKYYVNRYSFRVSEPYCTWLAKTHLVFPPNILFERAPLTEEMCRVCQCFEPVNRS